MTAELVTMEIVGLWDGALKVQGKRGKVWLYHLRNELEPDLLALLQQRQNEGWPELAFGIFKPLNDRLLVLESLLL